MKSRLRDFEQLLAKLISFDTVYSSDVDFGYGNKLGGCLDFMLDVANKDGFKTSRYERFGMISTGNARKHMMTLFFHLDVVTTEGQVWNYDPFELKKCKYGYTGRGVMDNKGPFAVVYTVLKTVMDKLLDFDVSMFLGLDEERNFSCIKEFKQLGIDFDLGLVVDAKFPVIYGEKGSASFMKRYDVDSDITLVPMTNAFNTVVGEVFFKKRDQLQVVSGELQHSSKAILANNAVYNFLLEVGDNKVSNIAKCQASFELNDLGSSLINPTFMKQVGSSLDVYFDFRYTLKSDIKLVEDFLDVSVVVKKPSKYEYNIDIVNSLLQIYQRNSDDYESVARVSTAGTYSGFLKNTFVFGFESKNQNSNVHGVNEFLSFENVKLGFDVFEDLFLNYKFEGDDVTI